jgi:hypothetical protein
MRRGAMPDTAMERLRAEEQVERKVRKRKSADISLTMD